MCSMESLASFSGLSNSSISRASVSGTGKEPSSFVVSCIVNSVSCSGKGQFKGQTSVLPGRGIYDGLRLQGGVVEAARGGKSSSLEEAVRDVVEKRWPGTSGDIGRGVLLPTRGVVTAVFERFTERAIKCVFLAQREAKHTNRSEVGAEHLLLGLIAEEERARDGFLGSGVTLDRAREAVRQVHAASGMVPSESTPRHPAEIPFSQGTKHILEAVHGESRKMGHNFIAPEHLAVCLLSCRDARVNSVVERLGLRKEKLVAEAISRLQGEMASEGQTSGLSSAPSVERRPALSAATANSTRSTSRGEKGALSDFCVDITARAAEGKIDPVIGRDKETLRVVQILGRRTKNNPILLGEPGVGKTAVAEGLALLINAGTVPEYLSEKRLLSLDMGLLLAGAKERGELENRVTKLVEETRSAGDVILFIDEVHTIVGSGAVGRSSGSGGGGLDIANLLKPALARGELQCIGATTLDEHRKHIEKDKALARRFQPVMVHEPNEEDAVAILMGLRPSYERHHKCRISDEAVVAAVQLSSRYIADRYLPDKAIDLLDEAGSRARIQSFNRRKVWQSEVLSRPAADYWREIRAARASFIEAAETLRPVNTGLWMPFRSNTSDVESELASMPNAWTASKDSEIVEVGVDEMAAVASLWSGIPLERLTADQENMLLRLESELCKKVVGQEEAVRSIVRAVRRARVGLKDPDRPIASLMFCGPTGVGKTQLTKCLAAQYFGSEAAMIRLDMSEYMERHTVSKLVGSPPGYVGYGEGGRLTEAVRRRPFTVVLFDEIEKAHPDVFNLLLQIFEDGCLTDSQGRVVSFKNTVIVMTSNVGSQVIARGGGRGMGFNIGTDDGEDGSYAGLRSLVQDELKTHFRPEFLNRLDEIVVFRQLEMDKVRAIVDILVAESKERMSARGLRLEVTEAMLCLVCGEGYDRAYGARPLRRAIMRLIEDPLSEALLAETYKKGDVALLDVDENGQPSVIRMTTPDPCDQKLCLSVLRPVTITVSD